jgi:hypothetical protein
MGIIADGQGAHHAPSCAILQEKVTQFHVQQLIPPCCCLQQQSQRGILLEVDMRNGVHDHTKAQVHVASCMAARWANRATTP